MSILRLIFAADKRQNANKKRTSQMNTFLVNWDPQDSGCSLTYFEHSFPNLEFGDIEWLLDSAAGIRSGDNFIIMKTGRGSRGVVMRGFFLCDPDAGKDGEPFTVSVRPVFMIHPEHPKGLLSGEAISSELPWSGWTEEDAVNKVPEDIVRDFAPIWDKYLGLFSPSDYDDVLLGRRNRPVAGIDEAVSLASEALFDRRDAAGRPAILGSLRAGLAGNTEEEMIRGFLSETAKDPDWDAGALRERGFSESVIDSLLEGR